MEPLDELGVGWESEPPPEGAGGFLPDLGVISGLGAGATTEGASEGTAVGVLGVAGGDSGEAPAGVIGISTAGALGAAGGVGLSCCAWPAKTDPKATVPSTNNETRELETFMNLYLKFSYFFLA